MKREKLILFVLLAACLIFSFFAIPVFAAEVDDHGNYLTTDEQIAPDAENIRPQWGTYNYTIHAMGSGSFTPMESRYTYSQSFHWRRSTYGAHSFFDSAVHIPSGAQIMAIEIEYCDNNTGGMGLFFAECEWGAAECTYQEFYPSRAGCGGDGGWWDLSAANIMVDNYFNSYHVRVRLDGTSSTAFRVVNLYYQLQVSPAPATATFTDVPTSHQYFQFIEALADSGITTGYPDGTFRPGSYVTRGLMAVFLSKALGLDWPN